MRFLSSIPLLTLYIVALSSGCAGGTPARVGQGSTTILYPDSVPLGDSARIFLPGIVSSREAAEYAGHFSPDGRMFFFTRVETGGPAQLMVLQREGDRWTTPRVVPFASAHGESESCMSPDGRALFFVSTRPTALQGPVDIEDDFWVVETSGSAWSAPELLSADTEFGERRMSPSVSSSGTLYFSGDHDEPGQKDIYRSVNSGGRYATPQNLGGSVNSEYHEEHVYVAPDESYVLYDSYRPGGFGDADIYVSFRDSAGGWSEARNLGRSVNSSVYDWYPTVTPDGRYILFARTAAGQIDLYWARIELRY